MPRQSPAYIFSLSNRFIARCELQEKAGSGWTCEQASTQSILVLFLSALCTLLQPYNYRLAILIACNCNLKCAQGKTKQQRYDTTKGESRTKSPFMSQRAVLADRDLIQSLHAAASCCFVIFKTCKAAHSVPRRQQKNVSVQIPLRCEKHDKQINEHQVSGSTYAESKNTHTFRSRRADKYIGQLWTLIGALRVCLLSSPHQA